MFRILCFRAVPSAVLILLLTAARVQAATFYVSTSGNDAWSGTLAVANSPQTDGPVASLAGARDAVRRLKARGNGLAEAVRIRIRAGTYHVAQTIVFTPSDSGTLDAPVSYEAYPGETPVLCGGKEITGWQPYRGQIQSVVLPDVREGRWNFRSLYAAGQRQIRARSPNFDSQDPYRKGFFYAVSEASAGSATEFHYAAGDFKPSWAQAPEAEIHIFQSTSCRAFKEIVSLRAVDPATRTVTVAGKECATPLAGGDRYFVENVLEELDSPGEWHLDRQSGRLCFWPREPITARSPIVAPVVGRIVAILGDGAANKPVRGLRFRGLVFQDTDYSPDDGCAGYGMGNDGVVYLRDAADCTIEDCTFRNVGKYAVCLSGGRGNAVRGNDISHGAEGGVLFLGSAGNVVSDNHVHHCGLVYKHVGGVILEGEGTDDNVIAHNLIHDISRYGISLKNPGRRNSIEYNRVLNTSLETCDTGGIEVTQGNKDFRSGSVIRNNIVGDSIGYSSDGPKAVFLSWGIYLDSFAGGYTVTHNITYRSSHGGMMLQGGKDNRVENNIFVDSTYSQLYISNFANNSSGQVFQRNIVSYMKPSAVLLSAGRLDENVIRIDRNLYHPAGGGQPVIRSCASFAEWQKRGFDQNSMIADPCFADPAHDDYALRPDSPAWKLGFEPIDTNTVGLLHNRCRCTIRPAAPDFGLAPTRANKQ